MINIEQLSREEFLIFIKPNSSLIGNNRIIFISSIAFICLTIATIFYLLGATLILPFAGLEIAILVIAFILNFKWSSRREKIYISQDIVKIEKGIFKAEYTWKEFRTFTSFEISKDLHNTSRLSFQSKGKKVEVGKFLNEEDKNRLQTEITNIISMLNS